MKLIQFVSTFLGLGCVLFLYAAALIGRIVRVFIKLYLDYKYGQPVEFASARDAFFMFENKTNLFETVVLNVIEDRVDLPTFRHRVETTWLRAQNLDGRWTHLKLRQCLRLEFGYFFWTIKPNFRLDDHFSAYDSVVNTNEELHRVLGEILSTPLPRDRPLWSFTLIYLGENFPGLKPGKHTCLILKYHHGVADGVSTVRMFNSCIFDEGCEEVLLPARIQRKVPLLTRLYTIADVIFRGIGLLIEDMVLIRDYNVLAKPKLTGVKLAGLSAPISMARLKRIKNATGTTINDLLMCSIAGALRSFLIAKNSGVPKYVRFYMPMSLHSPNTPARFTNYTSAIFHNFAVQESTAFERLMLTKRRMDEVKNSPQVLALYYTVISCCSSVPHFVTSLLFKLPRVSGICSNVPGPRSSVFFKGKEFLTTSFFLAVGSDVGITFGAFTLNDAAQFSLKVDTGLIKTQEEVETILSNIHGEIGDLEKEIDYQSKELEL